MSTINPDNFNGIVLTGDSGNNTLEGSELDDYLRGLAGDDILKGYSNNDTLEGGDGADTLYGGQGDDLLIGGTNDSNFDTAGNTLYGEAGNDTLIGGSGNDDLEGGTGNDSYYFGIGSGQDRIYDYDSTAGNKDTVLLQAGVTPANLIVKRDQYHIYLSIKNTSDKLTISNWFLYDANKIEQFKFADGTTWDSTTLLSKIVATDGNDYLTGDTGANILAGLKGDDTYVVDNTGDVIIENFNEGNDSVYASISYTLDANIESLYLSGSANINATGNDLNNWIGGNYGNNVLDGGAGNDSLNDWNGGNDSYVFGIGCGQDTVRDYWGNADTILLKAGVSPANLIITRDVNNLFLGISSTTDTLTIIDYFRDPNNKIEQIKFADGTIWNEATILSHITEHGTDGNDYLGGDSGANTLAGLKGDDTYSVDNSGDVVIEKLNEGTDTVLASVSYTLPANVENLTLTGTAAINATGNELNNTIYGNSGDNIIDGGAGNDVLNGKGGKDSYVFGVGSGQDTVSLSYGDSDGYTILLKSDVTPSNLIVTREFWNSLTLSISGTSDKITTSNFYYPSTYNEQVKFADGVIWDAATLLTKIVITDGNDYIGGDTGANTLSGLKGNDTYVVNNSGDVVIEKLNEGNDTVESSINTTLAANVENLTLTGTDAIDGTGNELNNTIVGNSGDNILDGGAGNDYLYGGSGNDTYVFGIGSGQDTIYDYSYNYPRDEINSILLKSGVTPDNLIVTVPVPAYFSPGYIDQSSIYLNIGIKGTNDTLILQYWFRSYDANSIQQVKFADGTIWSAATLESKIVGTIGNDYLPGTLDANTLPGLKGDDTYIVNNPGDVIIEKPNEGTDTVQSSITYTLAANVEYLRLTGTAAINGIGNELNNTIFGNSDNNILDGKAGSDILQGDTGDDTYIVDVSTDTIYEYANQGTDSVLSSVSYTLTDNIENLTLTGLDAINATGNDLDNVITGNAGNNILSGRGGGGYPDWRRR